jgi:DNA modification methylase
MSTTLTATPPVPSGQSVQRAISQLKPAVRNPRTHSKKQIAQIARSIEEFGFVNPVLIDGENRIVAGHGRVEAAKLLGLTSVPTVAVTHLSAEQLRLYAIVDNRLAELSGWDDNLLAVEFEDLSRIAETLELNITGFELPAIDLIIQARTREPDPEDLLVPDDPSRPVVSRTGDVWLMGDHKIVCGDALLNETYDALLGGEQAQMVFSDPPYNVKIDGHVCGLGSSQHADFAMASGEMSVDEFTTFLGRNASNLVQHSVDGALHFTCMDWRHLHELLSGTRDHYSTLLNLCVWDKGQGGMGSFYRSQHEIIAVFKAGKGAHINNVALGKHGRNRTNVWKYPGANSMSRGRTRKLALHPTVKPVALVADAILDASHRSGVVLDPFGGSGTTILAAERTGRRARVIEIEPKYVDVAIERWRLMTGNSAVHAETGLTFEETTDHRRTSLPVPMSQLENGGSNV